MLSQKELFLIFLKDVSIWALVFRLGLDIELDTELELEIRI